MPQKVAQVEVLAHLGTLKLQEALSKCQKMALSPPLNKRDC